MTLGSDVAGVVERAGGVGSPFATGDAVFGATNEVGDEVQDRSFGVLKRGGVLVSAVSVPDQQKAARHGVRALFFLVEVSTSWLERIAAMIDAGELTTNVGEVLPLSAVRVAHEMLAGKPHKRGKIVLTLDDAR